MNYKGADQTMRMLRLICAFVFFAYGTNRFSHDKTHTKMTLNIEGQSPGANTVDPEDTAPSNSVDPDQTALWSIKLLFGLSNCSLVYQTAPWFKLFAILSAPLDTSTGSKTTLFTSRE